MHRVVSRIARRAACRDIGERSLRVSTLEYNLSRSTADLSAGNEGLLRCAEVDVTRWIKLQRAVKGGTRSSHCREGDCPSGRKLLGHTAKLVR